LKETELRAVNCPALIVSGDRTHDQYRLMADATLDSLPNASAVVYEGVGHGGPVQVPNRFAKTILDFVKGVST
jgi:pimeloyl-ACP methyl ester carboxylesterase